MLMFRRLKGLPGINSGVEGGVRMMYESVSEAMMSVMLTRGLGYPHECLTDAVIWVEVEKTPA